MYLQDFENGVGAVLHFILTGEEGVVVIGRPAVE